MTLKDECGYIMLVNLSVTYYFVRLLRWYCRYD